MVDAPHTITRKSAADMLAVSARTLDRYVRKKSLTTLRRGRELYFDGKEVIKLKAELQNGMNKGERGLKVEKEAHGNDFIEVKKAREKEQEETHTHAEVVHQKAEPLDDLDIGFAKIRDELLRRSPEEGIYKVLFEKVDAEHKDTRKKLDMATFKLGSLEAQVKSMVPLIQYRKKNDEALQLAEQTGKQHKTLKILEKKLQGEIWIKRIYAGFLFIMTALIPLLLILRLVSGS